MGFVFVFVRIEGKNVPRLVSCLCSGGRFLTQVGGVTRFRKDYSSLRLERLVSCTLGK